MHTTPRFRARMEAAAIVLLQSALRPLPPRWASALGVGLGWLLFTLHVRRRATLATLATAFGTELSEAERLRIAAACYRHFGALIAEFLVQPRLAGRPLDACMVLENAELLDELLGQGKGLLIAAGHLGNWELMGAAIAARGYPFAAYVGRQHNPFADALVNNVRTRMGMEAVPKQTAMRGMLRALKGGRVLTILTDQHFSRNRYFVRFFGKPVSVAPGMASLIRHTGVPAVFADVVREGRFRYRTRFVPLPVPPPGNNEELDLLRITQAYFDLLEAAVRRHPAQYFWMHKRWRPPPRGDALSPTNRAFLAGETPPEPVTPQPLEGSLRSDALP